MGIAHNDPAPKRRGRRTAPTVPAPPPAQIDDIPQLSGWRWYSRMIGPDTFEHALIAPDGWETKRYQRPTKAIAEALRRVRSQPRPKDMPMSTETEAVTDPRLTEDEIRALEARGWRHAGGGKHDDGTIYLSFRAPGSPKNAPPVKRPRDAWRALLALPDLFGLPGWQWEWDERFGARLTNPTEGYATAYGGEELTEETFAEARRRVAADAAAFAEARRHVAADPALVAEEPPIRKGPVLRLSAAPTEVEISRLRRDGGTQPRAGIDREHVARLEEALAAGETLPPVVVYYDGSDHWLADGYHRVEAHERRQIEAIAADVRQGTRRDAVLYSTGANRAHGLPRSRDDLRRAIETLLRDDEWGRWSDREIARQIGCSPSSVGSTRRALVESGVQVGHLERKAPDGKTYTVASSKPAAPATLTPEELVASIRSALLRLDVHAAAPLLAGLSDARLAYVWRNEAEGVRQITGLIHAGRQREAHARAKLLHDDTLRQHLLLATAPAEPAESPDAQVEALIAGLETIEARLAEGCAGAEDVAELTRISEQADDLRALNLANRADQLAHEIGLALPAPALPEGWSWRERGPGSIQAWDGTIRRLTACYHPGQEQQAIAEAWRLAGTPPPSPEQAIRNALMGLDTDTASRLAAADPALLTTWAADIQTTLEIGAARRDGTSIDPLLARVRDGQLRAALAQLSPTGLAALDAALGEDVPAGPVPAVADAPALAPAGDDGAYAAAEPILARILARLSPAERAVLAAVTLPVDDLDLGALDDPGEALWEHWTFVAGDRLAYLAEALEAPAQAAPPEPWPESDHPDLDALSSALMGAELSSDPPDAGQVAAWQDTLDACASEISDETYERLAHRIGELRRRAKEA